MATKLGAVAKCVFVELLHGCRGGWSEIKSFHRLEVSSLVLYTRSLHISSQSKQKLRRKSRSKIVKIYAN